ncbi:MAG: hypothetical protein IH983_12325, partial [Planctomycetes bacterium]|nr:hypothetical protein [Planctomycetota bacterium]
DFAFSKELTVDGIIGDSDLADPDFGGADAETPLADLVFTLTGDPNYGTLILESGGTFEIISGPDTTICPVLPPIVTFTGTAPNRRFYLNFYLPDTCVVIDTVDIDAKIFLRVRKTPAIPPGLSKLELFRAEFMGTEVSGDSVFSCDHWGANFKLLKPTIATGISIINMDACEEKVFIYRTYINPGVRRSETEDFPDEHRDFIAWDSVVTIYLPPGYEYVTGTGVFIVSSFASFKFSIPVTPVSITTVGGDTLKLVFIEDWPLTDVFALPITINDRVIITLSFKIRPVCEVTPVSRAILKAGWLENHYSLDTACFTHTVLDSVLFNILQSATPELEILPPATVDALDRTIEWDFKLCNNTTASQAPFTWMSFRNPSGNLQFRHLIRLPSDTITGSTYLSLDSSWIFFPVDSVYPINTCRDYRLTAYNTNCDTTISPIDSFFAITGFECDSFPIHFDSATCIEDSALFYYRILPSNLQMLVIEPDTHVLDLCDTLLYTIILNSSSPGTVYDIEVFMDMADSLKIISACYRWPISATCLPLPPAEDTFGISGTLRGWDLGAIVFNDTGLIGSIDTGRNKILLQIELSPVCGFLPGGPFRFHTNAIKNCADQIVLTHNNEKPEINGLPVPDTLQVSISGNADSLGCFQSDTITVTIINPGDTSLNLNLLDVRVPIPLDTSMITPAPTSTTGDLTGVNLFWLLPSIPAGDTLVFTFIVTFGDTTICDTTEITANISTTDSIYCDTSLCVIHNVLTFDLFVLPVCCDTLCFAEAGPDTIFICANATPDTIMLGGSPSGPPFSNCTWSSWPFPGLVNIPWLFSSPTDCNPLFYVPFLPSGFDTPDEFHYACHIKPTATTTRHADAGLATDRGDYASSAR